MNTQSDSHGAGPDPESLLDPAMPIIDPHHHLRDRAGHRYLFDDFQADFQGGHNIVATVTIECGDMYYDSGPKELRPIGEIEFLNGVAAMYASGRYGSMRGLAGIVGFVDLRLGDRVQPVLDAAIAASGGRLCGIRNPVAWHDSAELRVTRIGSPGTMQDSKFRAGLACLGEMKLPLDLWLYHTQLSELRDLARACPDNIFIVNHIGGPVGVGPYAGKRAEVFEVWSARIRELAECPNIVIKIGGMGMPIMGFGFETRAQLPSSSELAEAWRPYFETCIQAFGPERSMFESNFPPDKDSCPYVTLWNAFKRLAAGYSETEKDALFRKTAARIYHLSLAE